MATSCCMRDVSAISKRHLMRRPLSGAMAYHICNEIYVPKEGRCGFDDCTGIAQYTYVWCGVNQYGKNPLEIDRREVCGHRKHMLELLTHEDYGGVPDKILDRNGRNRPRVIDDLFEQLQKLRPERKRTKKAA